ncbi:MAG: hypothetical protein CM15mV131_480 [uncultured marine virus]|nr:MAG: hypothetical protein CM15mV131_480 [uncultured marine virus]
MVIRWLDSNIDDGNLDLIKQEIASDSRDLKKNRTSIRSKYNQNK